MLAVQHLNTGNGRIVPQIQGLNERCDIRFTAEFFDTGNSQADVVEQALDILAREPGKERLPCAFLGSGRSSDTIPSSIMTGIHKLPQVSPSASSKQLDDKSQHPYFGRTFPSDGGTATPVIHYLLSLGVKHLAVVYVSDAYGSSYALGLQLASAELAPDMKVFSTDIPYRPSPEAVRHMIQLLKQTGYRYFFAVIFSATQIEPIMTEAVRQGIAGTGGHTWMFGDAVYPSYFTDTPFERDSSLARALHGTFRIASVGGYPGLEAYDSYAEIMAQLDNPQDIELMSLKYPTYPEEPNYERPLANGTQFDNLSEYSAGFVYDAAVALGLAACDATGSGNFFDGPAHFESLLRQDFDGVTGRIQFDSFGTREALTAIYQVKNFFYDTTNDTSVPFRAVDSDVFVGGQWQSQSPATFSDGSSTHHEDLSPVVMQVDRIGSFWRTVGWLEASLILMLSVAFATWTYMKRESRPVRAAQVR